MNGGNVDNNRNNIPILHQSFVDKLKLLGVIRAPHIERAFRAIPRHLFLPKVDVNKVYENMQIPIEGSDGEIVSSASQPSIMATMLEQLELKRSQKILEIGTGTGYNAALLAHIVGNTGQVFSVEIDEDLAKSAYKHLLEVGFSAVKIISADGSDGYLDFAPYDRIILTAGAWEITPVWWNQLKPQGLLLLPLSIRNGLQLCVAFKHANNHLVSTSVKNCGFMMLHGANARCEETVQIGSKPGLYLSVENSTTLNAKKMFNLLTGSYKDYPTSIRVSSQELREGLIIWLALYESTFCRLVVTDTTLKRHIVSGIYIPVNMTTYLTWLVHNKTNVCTLGSYKHQYTSCLFVRNFGTNETLVQRLLRHITAWHNAGCPTLNNLNIKIFPKKSRYIPSASEVVIEKQSTNLVIRWQ